MQTIQELYYRAQVNYILRYDVHPCTEADLNFLEEELGFILPNSYKTFLRLAGRQPNDFFGEDIIPFHWMLRARRMAKSMLQEDGFPTSIIDDAIVVGMGSQGYSFEIIRISEGESVFQYMEGEGSIQNPITKIADSFWEYIYKRLFSQLRIEKQFTQISIMDLESTGNYQEDALKLVEQMVLVRLIQRLKPVQDKEILKMENAIRRRLPKIYKEFLKWSGHGLLNLLDMDTWHSSNLELLQTYIFRTFGKLLSPHTYVFLVYGGKKEFDIFYLNEGDDPPVYHCKQDGGGLIITKVNESFSDYLIQAIGTIR